MVVPPLTYWFRRVSTRLSTQLLKPTMPGNSGGAPPPPPPPPPEPLPGNRATSPDRLLIKLVNSPAITRRLLVTCCCSTLYSPVSWLTWLRRLFSRVL